MQFTDNIYKTYLSGSPETLCSSLTPFFCLSIKLSIHPLIPLFTHILIEALICSDSLQNHQVLQWMKSWPKVTSMYPQEPPVYYTRTLTFSP